MNNISNSNDNLKEVNEYGQGYLHYAANNGEAAAVALLIIGGLDPNSADCFGMTPLHYAAQAGHEDVVDKLVKNGADITCRTNDGRSAADLAGQCGHLALAKKLKNRNKPGYGDTLRPPAP